MAIHNSGQITTTMGLRESRPPLCHGVPGGHRSSAILVRGPDGNMLCPEHAGSIGRGVVGAKSACECADGVPCTC